MRMSINELQNLSDSLVHRFFKRRKSHTLTIGVVTDDQQSIWGYGQPDSFAYSTALYEIGSITKVFVTSLLAILEKKGLIHPADTIDTYFPEWKENHKIRSITLEQLATHTSGLPRLPGNLNDTITNKLNPYENYRVQHLIDYIKGFDSKLAERFEYSNLGMGLLGTILSTRMQKSLNELIREEICMPLSMMDTSFTLHDEQKARLLPVYKENGKPVLHWDFDALAGAGALRSSASDLLTFIRAHAGLLDTPLTTALQETHRPRHTLSTATEVGLGWMVSAGKNGEKMYWHNGGTYGSTSFLGFNREKRIGVVVLSNNGMSFWTQLLASFGLAHMGVDTIGFKLLHSLMQRSDD